MIGVASSAHMNQPQKNAMNRNVSASRNRTIPIDIAVCGWVCPVVPCVLLSCVIDMAQMVRIPIIMMSHTMNEYVVSFPLRNRIRVSANVNVAVEAKNGRKDGGMVGKECGRSSLYGCAFYALTGLHGSHVLTGVILLIIVGIKLVRGLIDQNNHVFLLGVYSYWHFVDVVWIGLYAMIYVAAHTSEAGWVGDRMMEMGERFVRYRDHERESENGSIDHQRFTGSRVRRLTGPWIEGSENDLSCRRHDKTRTKYGV